MIHCNGSDPHYESGFEAQYSLLMLSIISFIFHTNLSVKIRSSAKVTPVVRAAQGVLPLRSGVAFALLRILYALYF